MQLLGERYKLPSLPSLVNYVDNIDGGAGQPQLGDFKCIFPLSTSPETRSHVTQTVLKPTI